jgi:AAA family ATP:ADP antiporter
VAISGLVWISAALLTGALAGLAFIALSPATHAISRNPSRSVDAAVVRTTEPSGGALLQGLWLIGRTPFLAGIAALVGLGSFLGMMVYVEMARGVAAAYPTVAERTAFFSSRDLWVNAAAFILQLFVVGQVTRRLGVAFALIAAGLVVLTAFMGLAFDPTLGMLTFVNIVLRCSEFGLAKPARDMLYTVVPTAAKYQSKNIIDTAVYRGSDMASGWIQAMIGRLGVTLGGWGFIAAGCTLVLTAVAALVGVGYRRRGGK